MTTDIILQRLDSIPEDSYRSIIKLIVEAVDDHPQLNMNDTDAYFIEIKKVLTTDNITLPILNQYIGENRKYILNNAWLFESLASLQQAFELMESNKISFEEVMTQIVNMDLPNHQ